jgi:parvulin-like peptidyl-prolyl isomerase
MDYIFNFLSNSSFEVILGSIFLITSVFAIRLNFSINNFAKKNKQIDETLSSLNEKVIKANHLLKALENQCQISEKNLANKINCAENLKTDLILFLQKGDSIVEKIEQASCKFRSAEQKQNYSNYNNRHEETNTIDILNLSIPYNDNDNDDGVWK